MLNVKPTIERLRTLFEERDGVLYWRQRSNPHSSMQAGDRAGRVNDKGYVTVRVDGVVLRGHAIVWALHYGAYPEGMLDHRNRCRSDNRIENLRPATNSANNANRASSRTSTSKYLGVSWKKQIGAWRATITKDGRHVFLGHFHSEIEAAVAYNNAAQRHHGQFACLNDVP